MADYDDDIWTNKPDMPRNPRPAKTGAKFESVSDPSVRVEHVLDEVGDAFATCATLKENKNDHDIG